MRMMSDPHAPGTITSDLLAACVCVTQAVLFVAPPAISFNSGVIVRKPGAAGSHSNTRKGHLDGGEICVLHRPEASLKRQFNRHRLEIRALRDYIFAWNAFKKDVYIWLIRSLDTAAGCEAVLEHQHHPPNISRPSVLLIYSPRVHRHSSTCSASS